jgi:hypothetical protein
MSEQKLIIDGLDAVSGFDVALDAHRRIDFLGS